MLYIKPGVNLTGLRPEMCVAITVAESCYSSFGRDCVITSAVDGVHSRTSLHYVGLALDFRTRNLVDREKEDITRKLQSALPDQYDVVLESDHIHIEFQPKRGKAL